MSGTITSLEPRAAVRLDRVTKVYGRGGNAVTALRDVSAALEPGSFTAVMGPSGSGKSTFLHVAAGLDRPTSGEVFVGDVALGALDETRRTKLRRDRVGFVFQSYNLVPSLTVKQNVTLPGRSQGGVRTERGCERCSIASDSPTARTTAPPSCRADSSNGPRSRRGHDASGRAVRRRTDGRTRQSQRCGHPRPAAPVGRRVAPDRGHGHPRPPSGVVRRRRALPVRRQDRRRIGRAERQPRSQIGSPDWEGDDAVRSRRTPCAATSACSWARSSRWRPRWRSPPRARSCSIPACTAVLAPNASPVSRSSSSTGRPSACTTDAATTRRPKPSRPRSGRASTCARPTAWRSCRESRPSSPIGPSVRCSSTAPGVRSPTIDRRGVTRGPVHRSRRSRSASGRPPADSGEVVVDAGLARRAGVRVGDRTTAVVAGEPSDVTVVGIARPPAGGELSTQAALFLDDDSASRAYGHVGQVDEFGLLLRPGADRAATANAAARPTPRRPHRGRARAARSSSAEPTPTSRSSPSPEQSAASASSSPCSSSPG